MVNTIRRRTLIRDGDKLQLVILNDQLHHPIATGLLTTSNLNNPVVRLGQQLTRILSSNEHVLLEECDFHITVIAMPKGEGHSKKIINLKMDRLTKKSITTIKNSDNLCCPRGIITALTYHKSVIFKNINLLDHDLTLNEIKKIREGDKYKLQKELAEKLISICDISLNGLGLEAIKKIEIKLNIQISVVCAENFNSIIYSGSDKDIKIYLYKNKNHFDVINSMAGFFGSSYHCHKCKQAHNNKD
jgi:hypothetical protein